jgi:hypothetical protein
MKFFLDPYFLYKIGWIKSNNISRYCPFSYILASCSIDWSLIYTHVHVPPKQGHPVYRTQVGTPCTQAEIIAHIVGL